MKNLFLASTPRSPFSHIDDLNGLFTQLEIDKAILFGLSAGGMTAIGFALEYPENVKALVLAGAVKRGYGYSMHFPTRGVHITCLMEYLEPDKFIAYFGWDDPYKVYQQNIEAKKKYLSLIEANPQNVKDAPGYFLELPERAAVDFIAEIKVPALILAGEFEAGWRRLEDTITRDDVLKMICRQKALDLSHCKAIVIPIPATFFWHK